ncbi:MAG: FHA domain-containing protein [Planctomycetes bacterium]|nr:FHA domain-containing protein [Planctomycetota bacterium]
MIIRLQHQRSDGDVDTYHLKSGRRYHIGRGSGCEVRILDLKLSRKHCAVEYIEGEWKIVDLLSTNGCKVDGDQIVGSKPLQVGSAIEIGQSTISVLRILGEDETDDDADEGSSLASVRSQPTALPDAKPASGLNGHHPVDKPSASYSSAPLEQESFPLDDEDEKDAPAGEPTEHRANDWEPEPEPEAAAKTGALVPNQQLDAKADLALEAARKAANAAVKDAHGSTGQLHRVPPPRPPTKAATDEPSTNATEAPRSAPASKPLPVEAPPSDGSSAQYRNTPASKRPSPLPSPMADLESGPFKSLDPRADAPKSAMERAAASAAPPAPPRPPSSSFLNRPKIVPVIVKAIDDDDEAIPAPPAPAAASQAPATPPVDSLEQTAPTFPAPSAAAPVPPPAAAAPADERTFYITVFGRRIGPLTRAVARDLKTRELKGTLTLKDLDQYK